MALGYDGVIRIDTQINRDGLTKGLKEISSSLEKEVRSSEKLLEDLQKKRGEALTAAQVKRSAFEEETAKAQSLKKELLELQKIADNQKLPQSARLEAEAKIPLVQLDLDRQKESVDALRREYEKISASVETYDSKIAGLKADLEVQRTEAQQAADAMTDARDELVEMNRSAEVGNQKIVELSHALASLKERQKTLENAGMGLGFQEYDDNVSKIAALTAQLKQYQKQLQETGEGNIKSAELMDSLEKIGASFAGNGSGISALAGGWQKQLDSLRDGLREAADAAGNAWENMIAKVKKNAAAVGNALAAVAKRGAALAKHAWTAGKNFLPLVRNLNGVSLAAGSLRDKMERLGNTIKRAVVFSVIYRGVSLLRQEMSAYLMVNQQFVGALAQIRGVLLTAFQPVYEAVLPALTSLLHALSSVIAAVSQFTASLFGTTAKKAQKNAESLYQQAHAVDAIGGAAKNAAKEVETAVAAFDEFNILSFPDQGSSGGGGGGAAVEMPDFSYEYDEFPFDSWGEAFSAFLDKLLAGIPKLEAAFRKFADWLNAFSKKLYDMFTFPGVLEKVERLGRDLADAFNKLVNWIDWYQLGKTLGAGLNLALQFLTEFLYQFDWINLGRKLAAFVNGLLSEIDWYDFGRLLWAGFKISLEMLAGFLLGLDMPLLAQAAGNIVKGFFDEMKNTIERIQWAEIGVQIARFLNNVDWYGVITGALAAIAAALTALKQMADGFVDGLQWGDIARKIYTAVNSSFGLIDWQGLGQTLGNVFIRAVAFLRDIIAGINWYQIGADVGSFLMGIDWVGALGALAEIIAAAIGAAIQAVRGFLDTVTPHIQEIARGIAEKINEFFRSVDWAEAGRTISDGLKAALDFALELMRTLDWNEIGQSIVTLLENIDWSGLLTRWGELMGETMSAKLKLISWDDIAEVGVRVVEGLMKGMLEKIASIGAWLKERIVDPVVNGVKNLFGIHSPSTVFAEIGQNLIAGLLQGISENWNGIVAFFSEKLGGIRQTVSEAWSSVKSDTAATWSNIRETIYEKVGGIRDKVFQGFSEVKSTMCAKVSEAMEELRGKDWASLGSNMVDGILNGLSGIFSRISGWASKVWSSITSAFSSSNARSSVSNAAGSSRKSRAYSPAAAILEEARDFRLPKLANGAVIPPNQQFAAILGDQRSGVNIEAPLATIEKALQNVLDRSGMGGDVHITVESVLDGKVIARNTVTHINDMTRSAGRPVLLV